MNQQRTRAIVLNRTDYGEADRILTLLTPEQGKLRLMARGVRRPKSKLAGGIELFSVSDISYLKGRGEIGTLVSTRLLTYYGHIVEDIERVRLGYELIKISHKTTEDQPEPEYFVLLEEAFQTLDDFQINQNLIRLWFGARLLALAGHQPNLVSTIQGDKLIAGQNYDFDLDDMTFVPSETGSFTTDDIKFLRLSFSPNSPHLLAKVTGNQQLIERLLPLLQLMLQIHLRI